jgi:hypothetical protein
LNWKQKFKKTTSAFEVEIDCWEEGRPSAPACPSLSKFEVFEQQVGQFLCQEQPSGEQLLQDDETNEKELLSELTALMSASA